MELDLAIGREREEARHMVALFLGLAVLVERTIARSWVLRFFLLWALRPAEAIALRYCAGFRGLPAGLAQPQGDSIAEARRFARCFRAAARAFAAILARSRVSRGVDRPGRSTEAGNHGHPMRLDFLAVHALARCGDGPMRAVAAIDSS